MRLLLTGFGAFGEVISNPTERVVRALERDPPADVELRTLVLPTSFGRARAAMRAALARETAPFDFVLMLGVAGDSSAFRVERTAKNRDEARIVDVDGARPTGAVIVEHAPATLPATLDVDRVMSSILGRGLPVAVSDDAGGYVCNHLMFTTLFALQRMPVRAGFLHVPADETTFVGRIGASRFEDVEQAVRAAIDALQVRVTA